MKILCVTPWFPAYRGDKEGNFVLDSIEALVDYGHAVSVLVTQPWRPAAVRWMRADWKRAYVRPELQSYRFALRAIKHVSLPRNVLRSLSNRAYECAVEPVVEEMARAMNAQVIHAHTEMAGAACVRAAQRLGIACVVTLHGINTDPRLNTPAQLSYYRRRLSRADRIVLVGEPLRRYFGPIIGNEDGFRVVSNGMRVPEGLPAPCRDPWGKVIRFVSVSNLHEGKGIDLNLRALAKIKALGYGTWEYNIVGGGWERERLEAMCATLGLSGNVTFSGPCDHDHVFEHLMNADVFILPSYREAFGVAYLEAMACGLLAIGVRGQGPEAFVRDGETGLLVSPRDVDDLASCLRRVIDSPDQMRDLATRGRELARTEFTWRRHAERISEVFSEAAGIMTVPRARALVLMLEPTSYIVPLLRQLERNWPGGVDAMFVGENLSQKWGPGLATDRMIMLPAARLHALSLLRRQIANVDYGLVHLAGWGHPLLLAALLVAWLRGIPVTMESDTPLPTGLAVWKRVVKRLVYPVLFRIPAMFLPGGSRQAAYLRFYGVAAERITVARMTVDTVSISAQVDSMDEAERSSGRDAYNFPPDAFVFLYVGRLEPHKGLDVLIRAFQGLAHACAVETRLLLVGEGSLGGMVAEAVRHDGRIAWAGRLSGTALLRAYAIADAFVLPSQFEPWGLVVNEAMAAGLPVIASSRVGCVDDLVLHGRTGLVFEAGSVESLVGAMVELCADRPKCGEMKRAGRALIAGWTLEAEADAMAATWATAIGSGRGKSRYRNRYRGKSCGP